MSNGHYLFAPSSAARTVICSGSVILGAQYPETEPTEEQLEGDAAHWGAVQMLTGKQLNVGDIAPNGYAIDADMLAGAALYYAAHVEAGSLNPVVEKPLTMEGLHPQCGGTPDSWDAPKPYDVHVFDYKYGHGFVDVFENWQLICYFFGIAQHLGIDGVADQFTHVTFHIVQPRSFHRDGPHRTWRVLASDLRPYFNILRSKFEEALGPNPRCVVSEEHCKHCPASHACVTLQGAALDAMDYTGKAVPFDLTPEQIGIELLLAHRALATLKNRVHGLETEALSKIRSGKRVPYFGAEQTVGKRVWTKPPEEVIDLGKCFGVDLAKPVEVISPYQAEQKGIDGGVISTYSTRHSGAFKLVFDDQTTSKRIFGK